ncbi:TetR/AcrR family transcriptional regulator [Brucella anthropi]|jgi:AcrR family transcriptional regulator|uniref:TetR/AcrR family transcriptional regulator n=1 Tax=Brucella anthropi TaxID=529 RepID=A0A011VI29_BRUAN|nr:MULTISPECIES: TetR/AcrR family transcriptional regulator [Brucella/Ochrobactrum group]MCR5942859.1 TetR/AcrR family transcriptional regulator [Ochrobactrum sp. XJ1]QOD62655.1 TetR/AcrR family transcriptional regulator [Ochrobactrum sp. MT180101]QTN03077.1 TetR family transcriptional regulator [Ochrobactrum sp. EEELCW01]EXL08100.1 TetR family transcriptional regulator [Brucella anthropi]KAB2737847.1 TetR/AcrR family transcriptional regulator [Brucella anthropi]
MKPTDIIDMAALPEKRAASEKGLNSAVIKPGQCMKRDFILCSAARVFNRDGFQGASIDLIANEAGVSRQTIYNHYRDKEALLAAVVEDALARMNASLFAVLATFPQTGENLEHDLVAFSIRMSRNCIYDSSGAFLRKVMQTNETNLPLAANICSTKGPAQAIPAIAARLARLAMDGHLRVDDPDLAARHFMALINADTHYHMLTGQGVDDAIIEKSAVNGVRTFLMAFGSR